MIRCQFCHQDNPAESLQCAHCGASLLTLTGSGTVTPELQQQIRMLLEEGNTIDAIKLYRDQTGAGLKFGDP